MAIAVKAFNWLSTLENEYDNNLVDFELMFNNLDTFLDEEIDQFRSKVNNLASLFAQLVHKSQTVFENNAKLEAFNLSLKKDLEESLTKNSIYRNEIDDLIKQIHCLQLKQYGYTSNDEDSDVIIEKMCKDLEEKTNIQKPNVKLEASLKLLENETKELKEYIFALQGELYGARLASKYLDKELAGRIQQIQLLSRKMNGDKYDQMWTTLESEINIQRQKTIVKAVKGPNTNINSEKSNEKVLVNNEPPADLHNTVRSVRLLRHQTESWGMSVTGGRDHGVPLLVSELYPGQSAALSGQLYVGDAILAVNSHNIRELTHRQAVSLMAQANEEMMLEVMYMSHNDDEDQQENDEIHVSEDGYMYRLYDHPKLRSKIQPTNQTTHSTEVTNHSQTEHQDEISNNKEYSENSHSDMNKSSGSD